jgi:hypothetical protein
MDKNKLADSPMGKLDVSLVSLQSLATNGARGVAPFLIETVQHLAVPQLARDVEGQDPGVNSGASDQPVQIYRWEQGAFKDAFTLPSTGGEDVEPFYIEGTLYLAVANLRSGSDPYDMNVDSELFRWDGQGFMSHQRFPTFAAKQWRHFEIDDVHFLALAQGVDVPGATARNPDKSTIYIWRDDKFELFQEIASRWGYNWEHIEVGGMHLLGYLDHQAPSRLLRWTGEHFEDFQELEGLSGRALCAFRADGSDYLAYARIMDTTILLRWTGQRYEQIQELSGPGGREFAFFEQSGIPHLLQVDFLTGSREEPTTHQRGHLYRWNDGRLVEIETFETDGATGVCVMDVDGQRLVAVSESLTPDLRFRTDSHVYALAQG